MHYKNEFIGIISLNHWRTESLSFSNLLQVLSDLLLRYINPHPGLAAGGLFEVLVLSSWRRRSQEESLHTHNKLLWPSESAIYADIHLGLYGQPVIFSAACLARLRQRAERHLCFNINVTQASRLWCTLAFCLESVWNLQTKHNEWWVVEAIVTGAAVHCTMPASQHVSGNHIETTETHAYCTRFHITRYISY